MSGRHPRVLLFGTEFPPSAAGTAVYARCLALALNSRGVDVSVLTQATAGSAAHDEDLPVSVSTIPYTRNIVRRYARSLGALQGQLRRLQPDCLWTTNGMGTRVAGMVGALPCPLITCARGSDIRTRLPPQGLWRRFEGRLQRRAYRRSAGIAAACQDLRTYAVAQGLDDSALFVSHSAFDFARLDALAADLTDVQREPATLLTVARLTQQKRVDVLLRAVALASRDLSDLRFTIVGDGPQRAHLEALAGELKIADRVRFAGALPPLSVPLCREYLRATAFALTSVGEGLANVFIEAAAFGLPSIGSDSGGTPEVVTDKVTGFLVHPDDPQDTAAHIVRLFRSTQHNNMGAAARAWAEREFGLDILGQRSRAVVDAAIAGVAMPQATVHREQAPR